MTSSISTISKTPYLELRNIQKGEGIDREGFLENSLIQDGVVRQLEIIGEAAKKLSQEFRNKYPQNPWKDMAGMRDKLIHGYFGVDLDAVWDTVKNDIPNLKEEMRKIKEGL